MEFLRNLLGSSLKPIPRKPESRTLEETVVPQRTLVSGELSQTVFNSEAEELPRSVIGWQYEYGKLLQSQNGPIQPRSEHTITGKSQELPKGTALHPNELFPANVSTVGYDQYPWQQEGGELVKQLIERDGQQYVVVAKSKMRSEMGEGNPGRKYTEMNAVVMRADSWSVAALTQLVDVLEPNGLTEQSVSLPTIEMRTDVLDQPLPTGWFDSATKDLLAAVVTGQPVAIQDRSMSEHEFLQQLFYVLCCLPESIARQVSFGTGLQDTQEGHVRIAHTATARYQTRKIGSEWKGIRPEDTTFGQAYVQGVEATIAACQTPRQVIAAMKAIPAEWQSAVAERFQTTR